MTEREPYIIRSRGNGSPIVSEVIADEWAVNDAVALFYLEGVLVHAVGVAQLVDIRLPKPTAEDIAEARATALREAAGLDDEAPRSRGSYL